MSGLETLAVHEWVWTTLSRSQVLADALGVPLGLLERQVWADVAPADATGILVVYSTADGEDTNQVGDGPAILAQVPLSVRAIVEGSDYGVLAPAARAITRLLHGSHNAVHQEHVILTCQRQGGVQYPEQAGGVEFRHLGGTFTVTVS